MSSIESAEHRAGIPFLKGHGTENDFVLIPDRDDHVRLSAAQVRSICDRWAGIGGDGLIRVVPGDGGRFFMDYRNADGSSAQMCGNGARLFARYLVEVGWERPGRFDFDTRGGTRTAELGSDGDVTISMGPVRIGRPGQTESGGRSYRGVGIDVGNPHLVCRLDHELDGLDLTRSPAFSADRFPEGVNIEWYRVDGPQEVTMRVYERGVGETRSCGTGTVAVGAAHLHAADGGPGGRVRVNVPGGSVLVVLGPERVPGVFDHSTLTGPAAFVAHGWIDPALLAAGR